MDMRQLYHLARTYLANQIPELAKVFCELFNQGLLPGEEVLDVVRLPGKDLCHAHVCQPANQVLDLQLRAK